MALEPSAPGTTQTPKKSARRILLVATLTLSLVAPIFLGTTAAEAKSAHKRTSAERSIGHSVVKLINAERRAHGLHVVHSAKSLRKSARHHNINMSRANEMSHRVSGEASLGRRVDKCGYNWTWVGENIGWNSKMTRSGVLLLQKLMYAEKAPYNGHRKNILSKHYKNVGIDVFIDKAHHRVWLTTDFGSR